MQKLVVNGASPTPPWTISGRCPHCNRQVTFIPLGDDKSLNLQGVTTAAAGVRMCASEECRGLVLYVKVNKELQLFPPERLDFDVSGIPPKVASLVKEAVACHAVGCYTASAIMIRRSLEEICSNLGATGRDLVQRIEGLKSRIVLPQGLIDAMHELRLFGNDAAHVEAKAYDEIGKDEIEVALELTQEIVKGAYQLSTLLGRMRSLKKAD